MRRALDIAGISPESIAAVKTHGIGTADSDAAELAALEKIFGTLPPLMAFKPQIGHTLGATAALETALLYPLKTRRKQRLSGAGNSFFRVRGFTKRRLFLFGQSVWFWRQQHIFGMAMATRKS